MSSSHPPASHLRRNNAVDLNAVDPAVWRVMAGEKVFGPYTRAQMLRFIREQRVAPDSMIAEGNGAAFIPAVEAPTFAEAFAPSTGGEPANFMIVARLTGIRKENLVRLLNSFGQFAEAAPGIFIFRAPVSLAKLRARIEIVVHEDDQVIIVDATHNRFGGIHLGPEADVHARAIWDGRNA